MTQRMKKTGLLTFKFIFILALFVTGCGDESTSSPDQIKPDDDDGVIVAVGDSLTEGLGVEEEFAYPAMLEKNCVLKVTVTG